jgi:hypothetical protein
MHLLFVEIEQGIDGSIHVLIAPSIFAVAQPPHHPPQTHDSCNIFSASIYLPFENTDLLLNAFPVAEH